MNTRNRLLATAAACLTLSGAPGNAAVIFDANFDAATPGFASDAPSFVTLMNSGTSTGSWSVTTYSGSAGEGPEIDNDGANNGALIGFDGHHYSMDMASAGSFAGGVSFRMDVAINNGRNDGLRDSHVVGLSGGVEVFRIIVDGTNAGVGGAFLQYVEAVTDNVITIGQINQNNSSNYNAGVMTNFRLVLNPASFDIFFDGGVAPVFANVPYRTLGVTDLDEIQIIGVDGRANFWADNIVVETIPEPTLPMLGLVSLVGFVLRRRR